MEKYYKENIKKVQAKQKSFLQSKKFLSLSPKIQLAVKHIFHTIISSPNLFCSKSNRTIEQETGVSIDTINRARLFLEEIGIVRILRLNNGKRVNKKYLLQMANCPEINLEETTLSSLSKLQKEAMEAISLEELLEASPADLINFNEYQISDTEIQEEQKDPENYYACGLDESDLEFLSKLSVKSSLLIKKYLDIHPSTGRKAKLALTEPVSCVNPISIFSEPTEKTIDTVNNLPEPKTIADVNINNFSMINNLSKAKVMEHAGFFTVPVQDKNMYRGAEYLADLGLSGRLALVEKCVNSFAAISWQDFYFPDVEQLEKFQNATFGKAKWKKIIGRLGNNVEHYKKFQNLGVILRKDMICIDIDYKDQYLVDCIKAIVPGILVQDTERGHHLFAHDPFGTLNGANFGEKIDLLKEGSHVVISHKDRKYEFVSGDFHNIPSLPQDFLSRMADLFRVDPFELLSITYSGPTSKDIQMNGKFQLPEEMLMVGERNRMMMRYAFSLRGKGYTLALIEQALWEFIDNKELIEAPLKNCEMRSLMRYVAKKPDAPDFIRYVPMYSKTSFV